jgi:hypothetical protein
VIKPAQKDLVYKEATFLNAPGKTLQEMLLAARRKLKFAAQREQRHGTDNDSARVWNSTTKCGNLTCGMFHTYEHGRSQLILGVADDVEEYDVLSSLAPEHKKKPSEFNEGLLFFGVTDNHVAVLQSFALRFGPFEEYLNWFLRDTAKEMDAENYLKLTDPPTKKRLKDRTLKPLHSVTITPSLHSSVGVSLGTKPEKTMKKLGMSLLPSDWKPLKAILSLAGAELPDELRLDNDFDPKHLQVSIELKWLNGDKGRAQTPVLDTIMHAFQDVENPPIRAVMVDGQEIKGEELRLRRPASIKVDGKIPVARSVYEEMVKFLVDLKKAGDIG